MHVKILHVNTYFVCNEHQLFDRCDGFMLQTHLQPRLPKCIKYAVKKHNQAHKYITHTDVTMGLNELLEAYNTAYSILLHIH